jgi:hypothetical protein
MAWTPPATDEIATPASAGWTPPEGDLQDAPAQEEHPAHNLGRALYDALAHAVRTGGQEPMDFTRGFGKGIVRMPTDATTPEAEQIGNTIGRGAPAAAGAAGAIAALPIVAPALAASSPLLAGAAASGLGAAAGDLAGSAGAKLAGGEAPATLLDAGKQAATTGVIAAATDLGVGLAAKAVATAAPRVVSMFKSFPKEGLKRTLQRPDEVLSIIDGAKNAQAAAETQGIKSLREVQNGLTLARNEAGKNVEAALGQFQAVTKGQPIIDGFEISSAGADALSNRSTSEGVSSITDSEVKKIGDLIRDLNKQGPMSARDAVIWRRKLDNLIDFKRGAVPEITSGEGQGVVSQMANALRQQIGKAASDHGFTPLAEANQAFSNVAKAYDAYRPAFNTKTALGGEAVKRLEAIERAFNKGGVTQADLTEIGQAIPALQKPVERLLDSVVARRFTLESAGSPSGMAMSAVRFLAGPDGLSIAANAARKTPVAAVRKGAGIAAAELAGGIASASQLRGDARGPPILCQRIRPPPGIPNHAYPGEGV